MRTAVVVDERAWAAIVLSTKGVCVHLDHHIAHILLDLKGTCRRRGHKKVKKITFEGRTGKPLNARGRRNQTGFRTCSKKSWSCNNKSWS